jgi:hypothetical protein
MSEIIEAPVVVTPGAEPTVPVGSQPSAAPVDGSGRQAIIQKYETMYGQPPAEPPAPVAVAPAAPPPPAVPDLSSVVASLQAELANLRDRVSQPAAPPPPPAASPAEEQDWLKYLAEGKKAEGEALLAKVVGNKIGEQLQQQAVEKTLALIEAQQFADKIRRDNADLMPMEGYITAAAAQRIEAATRAGKIRTPADYVTVYKDAINTELAAARQLVLTYRGEGRQDGASRVATVLATPNLQPSTVNTERDTSATPKQEPVMTTPDYLAMRQANKARGQGM